MSFNIKNNIYWVGKIDWELRKFHGDEYSTHRGTSYNSYLIKEDKVALIDTVRKAVSNVLNTGRPLLPVFNSDAFVLFIGMKVPEEVIIEFSHEGFIAMS